MKILSEREYRIMEILWNNTKQTSREIAEAINLTQGQVSSALKNLYNGRMIKKNVVETSDRFMYKYEAKVTREKYRVFMKKQIYDKYGENVDINLFKEGREHFYMGTDDLINSLKRKVQKKGFISRKEIVKEASLLLRKKITFRAVSMKVQSEKIVSLYTSTNTRHEIVLGLITNEFKQRIDEEYPCMLRERKSGILFLPKRYQQKFQEVTNHEKENTTDREQ